MNRTSRTNLLGALTVAALLVATPVVKADPATPTFGPVIEGLSSYDPQSTCSPTVKPGTGALRSLVLATYTNTGDSGIVRACTIGGTSEHKEGRAWDWRVDAFDPAQYAAARDMLTWLLATDAHGNSYAIARRLGVMYIIWDRHIWSAYNASAGWRPYSGSNPHTDHVHISLSRPGGDKLTTFWSPSKSLPPPVDPTDAIAAKWKELGGAGGVLGDPVGTEYDAATGRAQDYQGGTVYWSSKTGARAVQGSISLRYKQFGGPASVLGFPTTDEQDVTGGRASTFQGGRVVWSLATGVNVVYGAIAQKYAALGGPSGTLGLPVTDELPVAGVAGARRSVFQGGEVLWSAATGAHAVWGSIRVRYLE
ncbi:MAG: LGFP repeat-containing protein, partial [Actinomycetes bacterium]